MLDSPTPFQRLIERLKNPALYAHPADPVTVLETHISTVLLARAYAYKLKKPYNLGFLDFTTRETLTAAEASRAIFIDTSQPVDPCALTAQLHRNVS